MFKLTFTTSLILLLAACDAHDHAHEHGDPTAEACEHLAKPATPVTAAPSATTAPEVRADHKRYDVKLSPGAAGNSGVVRFSSSEKGHLLVFLSADVPLAIKTSTGLDATLNMTTKSGPCDALEAWYEYEVGVGRYDLTLGGAGTTADTVGLVLETEKHD